MIYGQNGTGKTTLSCRFPKPLLLISFEPANSGGAKSVKRVPDVTYLKLTSSQEALQLIGELQGNVDYATHVIDTGTSMQDIILGEVMGLPEVPVQLNFGKVSMEQHQEKAEKTKEVLRGFGNLPAHTVVLCQERDHNPMQDRSISRALVGSGALFQDKSFLSGDLGGAAVRWVNDKCDYIWRLYQEKEVIVDVRKVPNKKGGPPTEIRTEREGSVVRRLRMKYHPNYAGRCRAEDYEDVPEYIQGDTPQDLYDKAMVVIQGMKAT